MLLMLSPAKRLDFDTPVPAALWRATTEPAFVDRAAELIDVLRRLDPAEVAVRMHLSDPLAALNVARWSAWQRVADRRNSKPAILAFDGDVYQGLQAGTLTRPALAWAQRHLLILSGLYGVLRPLDRLQPYRLEMGTALATDRGRDLYAFWGDTLAEAIDQRLTSQRPAVLVNLASAEYARAVLRPALKARVVECVFEDWSQGRWRVLGLLAKRARGRMARWIIDERIDSPRRLVEFDGDGYAFDRAGSGPDRLVFRRRGPAAGPPPLDNTD